MTAVRPSRSELVAYCLPTTGVTAMHFLVALYLLKFSTDVLGLAPAAVGALFGAARLWDAVADPLAGWCSDRTRSRLGRRRPWLLAAALPAGLAFVALWSPPSSEAGAAAFVWTCLAVLGFYTALTAFHIPHVALGAELTSDYHERTRVFALRGAFELFGMGLAIGALYALENAGDARAVARIVGLGIGGFTAACGLVAGARVRERASAGTRTAGPPWRALADVWRNPHARRLLGVFFLSELGLALLSTALPYVSEHVLGTPGATAYYMLCYLVPVLLCIPVWLAVARRLGKARAWWLSNALCAAGFLAIFTLGRGDGVLIALLAMAIGAASSASRVIPMSIQADVIDWDELHTRERKEGTYFAAWNLVGKAAGGLAVTLVGFALAATGFVRGETPAHEAILGMRIVVSVLPAAAFAASTLLLSGFALGESEHGAIRAELDARTCI